MTGQAGKKGEAVSFVYIYSHQGCSVSILAKGVSDIFVLQQTILSLA